MTVDELLKKTDKTIIVGDVLFSNENDKWYAHPIEIKREENKMTNREWLETLSDEELAMFYATQSTICEMCDYTDVCISNITSEKCSEGVTMWLQAEHKKPKKELTQAQLCEAFELKFGKRRAISLDEIREVAKEIFK